MTTKQYSAIEKLTHGCAQLGIELSATQQQQLWTHLDLLEKWNRSVNLTAITDRDDMVTHHLLDSLSIMQFVRGQSLLDIGSGGGFPGLPLAIMRPDLSCTLLDSRQKRTEFLRNACVVLKLANVSVATERVESYQTAVKFDILVSRAFASLSDTLTMSEGLHRRGSRLLAMKGAMAKQEIALLDKNWQKRTTIEKLNVPFLEAKRNLLIVEL